MRHLPFTLAPGPRPSAAATSAPGLPARARRGDGLRLFLAGQALFQSGAWLQLVAQTWLALELSGDSTTLGWLAVATYGPMLALGPWTGAMADRFDRRRLLLVVHALAGVQAAVLATLALSGTIGLASIYALALAHGLLYAVEHPARRAFAAEIVAPPAVIRATSLTSAVSAGAKVAGPAGAGAVILQFGIGWCFAINAVACLIALAVLSRVRRYGLAPAPATAPTPWRGQAVAGLRYAWRDRELRATLVLTAAVTTLGFNHHIVIPVLAREAFDGGAGTYTVLASAMAAGALVGAVVAGRRTSVEMPSLRRGALAFGAAMTTAALSPNLAMAVVMATAAGATGLWFVCASTSLLQVRTDPAMRGRVMALATVVVLGSAPIGGPIVGWVCEQLGPRWGLVVGGAAALAAGIPRPARTPAPRPGLAAT